MAVTSGLPVSFPPSPSVPARQPPGGDLNPSAEADPDGDWPSWPLWTAPAAVVLGFMFASLGTLIVDGIAHARGASLSNPPPAANIIADIVFDLCFVATALWMSAWQGRPRAAQFGYRRIGLRAGLAAFVLGAVGYYGLTAVYSSVLHLHGSDKLPSDLGVTHSTAALVAASVFVCAIAPMAEEFFFRGFLFGALRQIRLRVAGHELGTWIAAVITGILFGLAHTGSASSQYLIPLGFLGFVLCLIRWRTRSLYPCMALHSANNALALGVNQLGWGAAAIVGLILASWLVIAAVTGPLALRAPRTA